MTALCVVALCAWVAAVPQVSASAPPDTITITRLHYGGGGDWYVSPTALPNLLSAIRERTDIETARTEAVVEPLDPALHDHPFLYATGHGDMSFTPEEAAAMRTHLEAGGFLLVNDSYGLDESFRASMARIFPDRELTEIPPDHPLFHVFYDFPEGLPKIHEHDGHPPQALGIFLGGRLAVLYVHESDIGDGWENADVHRDPPEIREQALRMGIKIFLYVLGQTAT